MARTTITPQNWPASAVAALPSAIVWTASDQTNQNDFALTGKEILLIWNSHASTTYTVTLTGVADHYGRVGTIGPSNVVAGAIIPFGPIDNSPMAGWKQTGNKFWVDANNAAIKYAVLVLP